MEERIEIICTIAVMGVMLLIMVFIGVPVNLWKWLFKKTNEKRQEDKVIYGLDIITDDTFSAKRLSLTNYVKVGEDV